MTSGAADETLTLVNFSSDGTAERLSRNISDLGFPCRVEAGPRWMADSTPAAPPIVLLDGAPRAAPQPVELIDRLGRTPWFCIADEAAPVPELLRSATEFVMLPVNASELDLRLARFVAALSRSGRRETSDAGEFDRLGIVGASPALVAVLAEACRAAAFHAPVVIQGETGTGKDLLAHAIHELGPRARAPFVPVNCGCLPADLVENELFGHEAGAYTGAGTARGGLVQQASGGTLFLDEVDALNPRAQVALLRFLQEGEVRAVGAGRAHGVDVRVLSASNAPLLGLVAAGRFREDLYFRLNVLSLTLPPLRRRAEDIVPLAQRFLDRFVAAYGLEPTVLEPAALGWLAAQDWPGNVRQLENHVHRAALNATNGRIGLADMRPGADLPAVSPPERGDYLERFVDAKAKALEAFERHYLSKLMTHAGGNVSAAAHFAGKERRALGKLLKKHGLDRRKFQSPG